MRKSALLLILCLNAAALMAAPIISDEDRSRFVERLYGNKEPGLRSADEYVALAKKMVLSKYPKVAFVDFDDGVVTYRTYRNAPKADHEMICVNFAYHATTGTHGFIGRGNIYSAGGNQKPVLLVLMRRDLSKVYVRLVHLRSG